MGTYRKDYSKYVVGVQPPKYSYLPQEYKLPKSHVKIITYMNNDNVSDLIISVVFAMSTQLGGIGPKFQELVISFCLGEEKNLSQFLLRALQVRSEMLLLKYETRQINNLTGKYILELLKSKHLQHYMTRFELEYS